MDNLDDYDNNKAQETKSYIVAEQVRDYLLVRPEWDNTAIAIDDIDPTMSMTAQPLVRMRDNIAVALRKLKMLANQVEEALILNIEANGDIELGDGMRLYVGETKTYKSNGDDENILAAVLEASNGDMSKLASGENGVLASQPWKQGAVHKLIGEKLFGEFFQPHYVLNVKTGKAQKSTKLFDAKNNFHHG